MRSSICSMAVVLACCGSAWSQYGYGVPTQPTQGLARLEDGKLKISELVVRPVYEPRTGLQTVTVYETHVRKATRTVQQNGRDVQIEVEEKFKVPVTKTVEYTFMVSRLVVGERDHVLSLSSEQEYVRDFDQAAAKIFEIDGEPADLSELPQRLERPTLVLLTHDGEMAEDHFSYMFKAGVLVVALPKGPIHSSPGPGAPMPAPMAAPAPSPKASASVEGSADAAVRFSAFQQPAAAPSLFPNAIPPQFTFAQVVDDQLRLRSVKERTEDHVGYCCSPIATEVKGDSITKDVCRPVKMEHIIRTHDIWVSPMEDVSAMTADSETVSKADLESALAREMSVLASQDGKKVDSFWLQNLKPRALVLTPPSVYEPAGPGACAPAPAPGIDGPPPASAPQPSPAPAPGTGGPPPAPTPLPSPAPAPPQ